MRLPLSSFTWYGATMPGGMPSSRYMSEMTVPFWKLPPELHATLSPTPKRRFLTFFLRSSSDDAQAAKAAWSGSGLGLGLGLVFGFGFGFGFRFGLGWG